MENSDEYFIRRNKLFDQFKEKRRNELGSQIGKEIVITCHGNLMNGKAFITTPNDLVISQANDDQFDENYLVAKVNGKIWDMGRVLEQDCNVEFCSDWNDPEVRSVFRKSSLCALGNAMEEVFKCMIIGGNLMENDHEGGFFCSALMNEGCTVNESDYLKIKKVIEKIVEEKVPFERLILRKLEALQLFEGNKLKIEMLNERIKDEDFCCVYRCGNFIDTSSGPHLLHCGQIKSFEIIKNSTFHYKLDSNKEVLQRIYGISFPSTELFDKWSELMERVKNYNFKKIGFEQELWFTHPYSPGMVFLLPHGKRLMNSLQSVLRDFYWKHGFMEVQSPMMSSKMLWFPIGGIRNYVVSQFELEIDKENTILKPNSLPLHCMMYNHTTRSYKELPIRYVEFGTVFRDEVNPFRMNQRLRSFQKDESTIFCLRDQTKYELSNILSMMVNYYKMFGLEFKIVYSTRDPNNGNYIGSDEQWIIMEGIFQSCLKKIGHNWETDYGGSLYGPRIEFYLSDCLKRFIYHSGTIHVDFGIPLIFDLHYVGSDNTSKYRPVCIHSTILSSMERFLALTAEWCCGKWPFWISPRQAIVIPVCEKAIGYVKEIQERIHNLGYSVDTDLSKDRLKKKIRNGHLAQYNYILIVGELEMELDCVNVRSREGEQLGSKTIQELLEMFETINTL